MDFVISGGVYLEMTFFTKPLPTISQEIVGKVLYNPALKSGTATF